MIFSERTNIIFDTMGDQSWITVLVTMIFFNGCCRSAVEQKCVRYDNTDSENNCRDASNCEIEICVAPERKWCYTYLKNLSTGIMPMTGGCFHKCDKLNSCDYIRGTVDSIMCCCSGYLCNNNNTAYLHTLKRARTTTATTARKAAKPDNGPGPTGTIIYIVTPIFGFIIVVAVLLKLWKKHKRTLARRAHLFSDGTPSTPPIQCKMIQMHDVISRGQFGYVWRALYDHKMVAVKVIPPHERMSWETERQMYEGYQLHHENILDFHSAEKRSEEGMLQYWIITEYHEEGSLADFLHKTVVDFQGLLRLVLGMASGLAYLHGEDLSSSVIKPIIAHRDFKSRNILVKSDKTCCIGDFGSSCSFADGYEADEAKAQVGTKRYMAPEVLEGAVAFQAEAFLCIDVYSLALVMWEVLSRCDATDAPVGNYRSPFEDEVGIHPTMEDMRACVLDRKTRPAIKPEWLQVEKVAQLCDTIEDCWDDDADARLTAHCVLERITQLSRRESDAQPVADWVEDNMNYDAHAHLVDRSLSEGKNEYSIDSLF